jgi:hypothetical protein
MEVFSKILEDEKYELMEKKEVLELMRIESSDPNIQEIYV